MRAILIAVIALVLGVLAASFINLRLRRQSLVAEIGGQQEYQRLLRAALEHTSRVGVLPGTSKPTPANQRATTISGHAQPSQFEMMHGSSEYADAWLADQRSREHLRYGALITMLNLSPYLRAKFLDIKTAAALRWLEINGTAHAQGLEFNDPAKQKLRDESQAQANSELQTILGPEGFARYEDFERTAEIRGFVDGFAVQMASIDPITPAQGEALAQAIANAAPRNPTGNADPSKVLWEPVDEVASHVLSENQLATWKLGAANNPYGGSRAMTELKRIYDRAVARTGKASN